MLQPPGFAQDKPTALVCKLNKYSIDGLKQEPLDWKDKFTPLPVVVSFTARLSMLSIFAIMMVIPLLFCFMLMTS